MEPLNFHLANTRALTRRHFFARAGLSLGGIALGSLVARDGFPAPVNAKLAGPLLPGLPNGF